MAETKQYQTSVYGQKKLNELQKELSETETFLRTKSMTHLGLVNILYAEAEHSRFTHGVGASLLFTDYADALNFGELDRLTGQAATMLHDIGYWALSHALSKYFKLKWGHTHEELAKKKITEPGEINDILVRHDINPQFVSELIFKKDFIKKYQNRSRYLKQLVAGDMDVDRLDFLCRDSITTAPYGSAVDQRRLINCAKRVDHPELGDILAYDEDALPAIQAFFSSYFSMYQAVYFNPNIKALEEMLTRALFLIDDKIKEKFEQYKSDPSMIPESEFIKALKEFKPEPGNVNHTVAKEMINLIFIEQKPIKDAAFLRSSYAPDLVMLAEIEKKFPYNPDKDAFDPLEQHLIERIKDARPSEIIVIRNPPSNHDQLKDVFIYLRNSGLGSRNVVNVEEVVDFSSFKKSHRHRYALRILTNQSAYKEFIPQIIKAALK